MSEEEFKGQANPDDDDDDEEEKMIEAEGEDMVAKTEPQFRTWRSNMLAQTNCMRILLKIADFLDTSKSGGSHDNEDDDDDDFEDCEDMDEEEEAAASTQVIDLDA